MRTLKALPFALLLFACGDRPAPNHTHEHEEEAGHHHQAPHGGTLVELGEHFAQLELLVDPKTGTLQAWFHDAHAENSIRLAAKRIPLAVSLEDNTRFDLLLEPVASNLTGESAGDSSQFTATTDQLIGCDRFQGLLPPLTIKGQALGAIAFEFPSGELKALPLAEPKK